MRFLTLRSPLLWLLAGGLPGIAAWWLLFMATSPARRAFLTTVATLVGGLLILAMVGYAAAQVAPTAPPLDEEGRSLLPGVVFSLGGIVVAVVALVTGLRAWRRASKETPAAAPATEPQQEQEPERGKAPPRQEEAPSPVRPRRVVVRGSAPEEATALERELRDVAELLGRDILVLVQPRGGDMTAFLHGEAVVVQVQRPQLHLVTRGIAKCLSDGVSRAPALVPWRQGPPPQQHDVSRAPTRRLRQEDLAAAIGGAEGGKGEG